MIIIHSYCTYKFSAIGFVYGSYEYKDNLDKDMPFYKLTTSYNNPFVVSLFESGRIRRACGKLPENKNYIFLVKKMKYDYGLKHEAIGRDVDMNFAFEFDNFNEFKAFATGFDKAEKQDPKQLYKELADCICPDKSDVSYKQSINKEKFDKWFKKIIKTEPSVEYNNLMEKIKITASSSQVDYSQDITDICHLKTELNGEAVTIEKIKESADYIYPVKKNQLLLMRTLIKQLNLKERQGLLEKLLVVFLISCLLLAAINQYKSNKINERKTTNLSIQTFEYPDD